MLSNCCNRTSSYSVYTTIQDLFGDLTLHSDTLPEMIASVPQFLQILDSINDNKLSTDAQILELFGSYILPSYYKSIVDIETFENDGTPEKTSRHEELLGRINAWCVTTRKYYGKLAKLYTENESKLLDQIKSTSTSTNRDSDVPQLDGVWDGDDQVSTIASASSETLVDNGSMMNRLNEIRSNYRDIMQLWMRDFYKNFLQEVLTW